jgi:hypothetical protein
MPLMPMKNILIQKNNQHQTDIKEAHHHVMMGFELSGDIAATSLPLSIP